MTMMNGMAFFSNSNVNEALAVQDPTSKPFRIFSKQIFPLGCVNLTDNVNFKAVKIHFNDNKLLK